MTRYKYLSKQLVESPLRMACFPPRRIKVKAPITKKSQAHKVKCIVAHHKASPKPKPFRCYNCWKKSMFILMLLKWNTFFHKVSKLEGAAWVICKRKTSTWWIIQNYLQRLDTCIIPNDGEKNALVVILLKTVLPSLPWRDLWALESISMPICKSFFNNEQFWRDTSILCPMGRKSFILIIRSMHPSNNFSTNHLTSFTSML